MSKLLDNSTPAERSIGCKFADNFFSESDVIKNGGTVTGSPTFGKNGVLLDGSAKYLTYKLGNKLNATDKSIVIEFVPEFKPSDDVSYYLFSTVNTSYVWKRPNSAGNVLRIQINGTTLISVIESAYSPYWLENKRNILVLNIGATSQTFWLNGSQIGISSITVTQDTADNFYIGARPTSLAYFKGWISNVKIFHTLLTQQDAINYYNNLNYNYMDNAFVNLQMREQDLAFGGSDLILDGDAELSGTSNWGSIRATLTKDTSDFVEGTQSLKVEATAIGTNFAYQSARLPLNVPCRYRGWYKILSSSGTVNAVIGYGRSTIVGDASEWTYFDIIHTDINSNIGFSMTAGSVGDVMMLDGMTVEYYQTLDVSGNDNHGIYGDGSSRLTFPEKLTKRGYSLNQASQFFSIPLIQDFTVCSFTFMLDVVDISGNQYVLDARTNSGNGFIYINSSLELAGLTSTFYVNGKLSNQLQVGKNTVTIISTSYSFKEKIVIGSSYVSSIFLGGNILQFQLLPIELTPLQVADLHLDMIKTVNEV